MPPPANAINEAGGAAYALSAKQALAQYAATGCFNTTYYATAEDQLANVIELCAELESDFIAMTATLCRAGLHEGHASAVLRGAGCPWAHAARHGL